MTKFENPSFNSPANSKEYIDNWDRIFNKKKKQPKEPDEDTSCSDSPEITPDTPVKK